MSDRNSTSLRNAAIVLLLAGFFALVTLGVNGVLRGEWLGDGADAPREQSRSTRLAADNEGEVDDPPPPPPLPEGDYDSPFVAVAERLKPAVVNITVERSAEGAQRFPDLPYMDRQPERTVTTGGSGVIIDSRGHVVTNHHVVDRAVEIVVTLAEGEERRATLVGTDPETDLALLDVGEVDERHVARWGDSDAIRIGDWAVAMGNPFGLDWTLTVGVISAKGRSDLMISGGGPVFQDFIQTDASINFGNSGGPLANIRGEVVGINAAINAAAQGIGFAIPANMARKVVAELRDRGFVRRGYLGMVPTDLTPLKREALGLDEEVKGIFVESVAQGTPADQGGLRGSDVIVEVDGKPVDDVTDFRMRIADHKPGDELSLTVLRGGDRHQLGFTLADRGEYVASANGAAPDQGQPWMGLDVEPLGAAEQFGLELQVDTGVLVVGVRPDSPARDKIAAGDVIVAVDGRDVEHVGDWREITSELAGVERAVLVRYFPQGRGSSRFAALKR